MDSLTKMAFTQHEHTAWQRVVAELRDAGVDLNTNDSLTHALKQWGESMGELRHPDVHPLREDLPWYERIAPKVLS